VVNVKKSASEEDSEAKQQDSAARVQRLAEEMRFRLKEAMAQHGGSDAFLHWLRSDGGKKA
jgi:hypothetical protein